MNKIITILDDLRKKKSSIIFLGGVHGVGKTTTHKKNEEWLASHPLVHFHFTPTSASWLNMVEIWFGIFSRKSLNGASFGSKKDLKTHIEAYSRAYNQNCKPFKWRKREVKGSQLKNKIRNFSN